MKKWLRFFFGGPVRLVLTLLLVAAVVALIWPGTVERMALRVMEELLPLVGVVLLIMVVFWGLKLIIFGRR
jgi:hypothetical protein